MIWSLIDIFIGAPKSLLNAIVRGTFSKARSCCDDGDEITPGADGIVYTICTGC